MVNEIKVGSVVLSRMGRDKGRFFLVTGIVNEDYVTISDGELRKIAKPKLKKMKHLKFDGICLDVLSEKLKTGKQVFDSEIRSALRKYNENSEVESV